MRYNCETCSFSNPSDNGDVLCDKRKLQGKIITIPADKVELNCPSHSHYPREEGRYDRDNKLHIEAEDVCDICHRDLDLLNTTNWNWVEVINEGGRKNMIKKCRICEEKRR